MNDYNILENLFKNEQDEIYFKLFKESNIIKLNNENKNDDFDNGIHFNTASLASKLINYKDAYILLNIECEIPYDDSDQGKKSIPDILYLKNSFELIKNLKIQLNNVNISNEVNVNRSSIIDFVLNNSHNESILFRNLSIASSDDLNIENNKFITKDTYGKKENNVTTNHFIDFEIPIFLKDISSFFNNIDIMHYAEFDILINLIDELFVSKREGVTYDIKSAHLIVEEIKLNEEDELQYLKKLDNGYIKTINFLENHVKIFNDKFNIVRQDFYVNNVRNGDSIYIYAILDANKEGMHYDLPSVGFKEPFLNIDNVRFENEIPNDISAFKIFKSKSIHQNDFLINYIEYLNYYRIYFWNISRQIKDDNANKFINIITGMETAACEVYIVFKTSASITLKYSKNDKLIVYKSQ